MCKRTSVLGTCRKNYLFIFDSQFILSHICEACPLQVAMYLFIYNKKEAGELMTKQNQVDITIHKVSTSHAYFHYKPELSINTKHIHKCTHTHTYMHTRQGTYIHLSTHTSIKTYHMLDFAAQSFRNFV